MNVHQIEILDRQEDVIEDHMEDLVEDLRIQMIQIFQNVFGVRQEFVEKDLGVDGLEIQMIQIFQEKDPEL